MPIRKNFSKRNFFSFIGIIFRLTLQLGRTPKKFKRGRESIKVFGFRGVLRKFKKQIIRNIRKAELYGVGVDNPQPEALEPTSLQSEIFIRPFYLDPYFTLENCKEIKGRVAVHFHLQNVADIESIESHLNQVPFEYDLFVSIMDGLDEEFISEHFEIKLDKVGKVKIARLGDTRENPLHSLEIFSQDFENYEIVGHFGQKCCESYPNFELPNSVIQKFDSDLGRPESIQQILEILEGKGSIVFADTGSSCRSEVIIRAANRKQVDNSLQSHTPAHFNTSLRIDNQWEFIFWSTLDALKSTLELKPQREDLPVEACNQTGLLRQVLEHQRPLQNSDLNRQIYCIQNNELSIAIPDKHYEDQFDFSKMLKSDGPKILAYYLPQFHPIPENDSWHGAGFTEWNKVRAANPQFVGHYQQHFPHDDIGYYDLASDEVLKNQVRMMKASGTHGMVFYHYWFKGRMVLEGVAARLLADPTIEMPFAFCWANENWTRRWDGDDNDILLKQEYSRSDALEFIQYLIPFFRDSRYIKVDDRPVIFVYRTISTANWGDYLKIWEEECELAGLRRPYVIATLTRGAQSAYEVGMDASVERVLHDWTDGNVKPLNEKLSFFEDFEGSVLNYSDVASYYQKRVVARKEDTGEPIFRSIVPNWDNTARYGKSAYVLHDSSPMIFQNWLEEIVSADFVANNSDVDDRFILVNAWNEWAEGAHLEPDTKYGYSYLNCIGRVLSGVAFEEIDHFQLEDCYKIRITFGELASKEIKKMSSFASHFINSLGSSQLSKKSTFQIESEDLCLVIKNQTNLKIVSESEYDFILHIENLVILQPKDIDNLVKFSMRNPKFVVCGNTLNEPTLTYEEDSVIPSGKQGSIQLIPKGLNYGWKISPLTRVFDCKENLVPRAQANKINVIIRFHANANLVFLYDCLKSLYAQIDVVLDIHLCLQDVIDSKLDELVTKIKNDFLSEHFHVHIHEYISTETNPDLRSLMLNETLKEIAHGFLLILDYDDILFPEALSTLANRLRETKKAVTFGKIYSSSIDKFGKVASRSVVYDWGRSYEDFLDNNFTPIHGFMMNLDLIKTEDISFHTDQKYMEDYFLTLQIFNVDNTDWDSLNNNIFIGDYNHRASSATSNTLALLDQEKRDNLLSDLEYLKCQAYVDELRLKILNEIARY
jgi:lipopolysaccharide biosynthesis protein